MASLPAFAGVLTPAPKEQCSACVSIQKSYRGFAERSGAALLGLVTHGSEVEFSALHEAIERREGPLFKTRAPDVERAGMPTVPRATKRSARGSAKKKPAVKV